MSLCTNCLPMILPIMVHLMHSKAVVIKFSIWTWDHLGMGTKLGSIIETKVVLSTSNVLRNSKLEMFMSNETTFSYICLVVGKVDGMSKSKMMLNPYQVPNNLLSIKRQFWHGYVHLLERVFLSEPIKKAWRFFSQHSKLPWGANLGSFGWNCAID